MNDVDVVSPTTDPAPVDELLCRTLSISTRRIACCADAIERDPTSLANEVTLNWGESGWVSLLETGHDHDPELHAAWVPLKTEAQLWAASLVDDDVATVVTDDLTHSWFPSGRPRRSSGRSNELAEAMSCVQQEAWDDHLHDRGSDLGWNVGKDYGGLAR
jgi:hypothetical protein